jgi:hypothetical protein
MQFMQRAMGGGGRQVWIRKVEHGVLRAVSLGFSLASAHAIRWFFAPLDGVDRLQPVITWMIALGFGLLGYFVSRGLAHRLMNRERIRAYLPICIVVEVVEIFCNYALAAAVIQHATWLAQVPGVQRNFLTAMTYVVLSIIPLVSVMLAVVDMDLERSKNGAAPGPAGNSFFGGGKGQKGGPQPKVPSYANGAGASGMGVTYPPYGSGYSGNGNGSAAPFGASSPTTTKAGGFPFVGAARPAVQPEPISIP